MMFNRISADGFFASTDANLDWIVPDDQIDEEGAKATPETDTVLFGRKTYEMFASFWPLVVQNPEQASDPHIQGRRVTPATRTMALMLNDAKKIVFSKSLKEAKWNNSRIARELDPRAIEELKRQPGKSIIIFGSGSLVSQLTQHGLIDEYMLVVNPIFLGRGRSLLAELNGRTRLKLEEARPYKSGNVVLRYVPVR